MSDEERALLGEIDRAMASVPRSPWKVALNRLRGIRNSYIGSPKVVVIHSPLASAVSLVCQRHLDRILNGRDLEPLDPDEMVQAALELSDRNPTPAAIKADLQKAALIREEQKVATAERQAQGIGRKPSQEEQDKAAQVSIAAAIAARPAPEEVTKQ